MRFSKLLLGFFFALIWESQCFGYGSIACGMTANPLAVACYGSVENQTTDQASTNALSLCQKDNTLCRVVTYFSQECAAVFVPQIVSFSSEGARVEVGVGDTSEISSARAKASCSGNCSEAIISCDGRSSSPASPPLSPKERLAAARQQTQLTSQPVTKDVKTPENDYSFFKLSKLYQDIMSGIGLGLGILIVILIYAKRAAIANFVIHGNLPYTIGNRCDDIEVLFKRSQRLNWNGRVIFGITAQLGMTEEQLLLVRRYRLGRVIAFDSLRRQRQNELHLLHLQMAAKADSKAKDDQPLSQMLAALRTLFWILFWYIRALFSFLLGFLFLRVTIAKLIRGKLIESVDLKLLIEAKTSIEQTAIYLKEYLLLAETFDGREEVYEPPA